MRRLGMLAMLAVMGGLSLTACNTIEGAGEDIESVGDGIQEGAG
jgi:predicted small secreted protein